MRAAAVITVLMAMSCGEPATASGPLVTTVVVDDMPAAGGLASSPNGQTAYCIDERSGAVVAFDPFRPGQHREVVRAEAAVSPLAIVALPGDGLATVCRQQDVWQVMIYRLKPDSSALVPAEQVDLGAATAESPGVGMVASRVRDWLAITGLPEPLPPIWRGIAVARSIRPVPATVGQADRASPVVAAAVGPADELVTLAAAPGQSAVVTYRSPTGRELLRLDAGLTGIRGAAFGRGDGCLWVVAAPSSSGQPAGVWRLDAAFCNGLQVIRPVCVAELDEPRALAAVSTGSLVVVHGREQRRIIRIDMPQEHHP